MSKKILELKNINKAYKDGNSKRVVLKDFSLCVEAGEVVAVVGPSGSGKSTLLSIAGALMHADSGEVLLDGESYTGKSQKQLTKLRRDKIGFIFQGHQLISFLKGKEQLELCKKKTGSDIDIEKLIHELGLEECINQYPEKMSGGERQRLAIARAFTSDPELILADEPTASLDGNRGRIVMEMLRKEAKEYNKGVVVVTHDERMLDLADRVCRLV